ncbi:MAG: GNAT family N-acetyltransferase, partial [Deltaproteobacteria bacterium]|nr:GNAT family N-acetyltransferase [Deltaproteobacteria bacterium]
MPFRINFAEGQSDFDISRRLFLEYAETLGFSLCFQGFDEELENLPG